MESLASDGHDPEQMTYDGELGDVLERAILKLPEEHRLVFMLREVQGMTTDETAESLRLTPENVKVRLHRARVALRKELYSRIGATTARSFEFHAPRCDRVVANVFRALGLKIGGTEAPSDR